ncbi:MAG: hypothetical protein ACREP3_06840 [Candidatus Binatia bacterium]
MSVYFKTTPRSELLRPFVDATDLSLLITGADGRPLKQGIVAIRLDAPHPGRFFSTDYPLVEGTVLSEMQLPLRQGRANWKQLLPIRGEYRLTVDAVGSDGTKMSKVFTFEVRENQKKWLALSAFSAGLLILGFVAGRVFTGVRAGSAVMIVGLVLSTGATGVSAAEQSQTDSSAVLKVESATVGKPGHVRWKMANTGDGGARTATLTLTVTHLEKQKLVFGVEKFSVDGEWSMKFHFPDAGEYRVSAVGSIAGLAAVRNEQVIAVTGAEPPATAMFPALAYFVGLIAVGLGAGRRSKRRGSSIYYS